MEGDKKRIPRERERYRETERKEDRKGGSEDKDTRHEQRRTDIRPAR